MIKRRGFSLIEVMLVVALLSVMTVFGISAYHKKTEKTKIDKAALQIQQLLQASAAFYNDNKQWPLGDPANINSSEYINFVSNYVPFGPVARDPWGDQYSFFFDSKKTSLFYVEVTVPNKEIANQIINRLPFAALDSPDSNTVKAVIGIPVSATNSGILIMGIGTCVFDRKNLSYRLAPFTCPAGETGYVSTSVQAIVSAHNKYPERQGTNSFVISQLSNPNPFPCTSVGQVYTCTVMGQYNSNVFDRSWHEATLSNADEKQQTGSISFQYITYCKIPGLSS